MRYSTIFAAILLSACQGGGAAEDSPLAALESSTPAPQFGDSFWAQRRTSTAAADKALWDQAKTACSNQDIARRPNCRPVLSEAAMEQAIESMTSR